MKLVQYLFLQYVRTIKDLLVHWQTKVGQVMIIDPVRRNNPDPGILLAYSEHFLDTIRKQNVIGQCVLEPYTTRRNVLDAFVKVLDNGDRVIVAKDFYARILLPVTINDRCGFVCRRIVDDNILKICERLFQNPLDTLIEKFAAVVNRRTYAN